VEVNFTVKGKKIVDGGGGRVARECIKAKKKVVRLLKVKSRKSPTSKIQTMEVKNFRFSGVSESPEQGSH